MFQSAMFEAQFLDSFAFSEFHKPKHYLPSPYDRSKIFANTKYPNDNFFRHQKYAKKEAKSEMCSFMLILKNCDYKGIMHKLTRSLKDLTSFIHYYRVLFY